MNVSDYYRILGISENASIKEIKNAFRRKAKACHPDINKSRDAHEKFIDINEAYTYLMNHHTRVSPGRAYQQDSDNYYRQWMERERQKARRHAAQRARMRFEEFRQSSIYQTTSMLSHGLDYFLLFLGLFIITAGTIGFYTQGLRIEDNGEEVVNIRGIIGILIIIFTGIMFISLSWGNIKEYRKKKHVKDRNREYTGNQ